MVDLFDASESGDVARVQEILAVSRGSVHTTDADGATPLIVAARNGQEPIVRMLIAAGANVNATKDTGATPLYAAADQGSASIVRLLLSVGADPQAARVDGATPLLVAAQNGHLEVVTALIAVGASVNATARDGASALMVAAQNGHETVARVLLKHGANVHATRSDGSTALYKAAQNEHENLVKLLLASGANPNAVRDDGATPLHIAAYKGLEGAVRQLVSAGASVNALRKDGATPLHGAVLRGHDRVVRFLLAAHADRSLAWNGETAWDIAAQSGFDDIATLLSTPPALPMLPGQPDVVELPARMEPPLLASRGPVFLTISWKPPDSDGGQLTGYSLTCKPAGELSDEVYLGTSSSYTQGNLKPHSQYTYRVAAVNEAGVGPYSSEVTFSTDQQKSSFLNSVDILQSQIGNLAPLTAAEDFDIDPTELLFDAQPIGEGTYGVVYKAKLHGTTVAVKKIKVSSHVTDEILREFRSEVAIMMKLRHPNVVLFMGVVSRPDYLCIITHFCSHGSLHDALHRNKTLYSGYDMLSMAKGMAQGLSYLHAHKIVHRDFKSANVLLDGHNEPKITDFGLSRLKHTRDSLMRSVVGTPLWMAPELLREEPYDAKVDVYGFGLVLWEMCTLGIPYESITSEWTLRRQVGEGGLRPDLPKPSPRYPSELVDLLKKCWQQDHTRRPTMEDTIQLLNDIEARLAAGVLTANGVRSSTSLERTPSSPTGSSLSNSSGLQCLLCGLNPKEMLFEPCRHVCCCTQCSLAVANCPVCSRLISSRTHVYIQ